MVSVEELCARGHDLYDLVFKYPISIVKSLSAASQWNTKVAVLFHAQAVACGVAHSLDAAFGKGKGKALQKFEKALFKSSRKSKNTDEAAKQLAAALGPRMKRRNGN